LGKNCYPVVSTGQWTMNHVGVKTIHTMQPPYNTIDIKNATLKHMFLKKGAIGMIINI
jgi:hypothetical protein